MYVKTVGPENAPIMFVGDAPEEQESLLGLPFIQHSNTGREFTKLVSAAGLSREQCLVTNVAREQPPGNNMRILYEDNAMRIQKPILKQWIQILKEEIEKYKPNIVVALGRHAVYNLTGEASIEECRGYILESSIVPGQKVIGTYHPRQLNFEYKKHFTVIMDIRKAIKNSDTREIPRDDRILHSNPSLGEFLRYCDWLVKEHKGPVGCDIETASPGSHIDIIGFAHTPKEGYTFTIVKNRQPVLNEEQEFRFWEAVAKVCTEKELVMQNGTYDATVLMHNNGIPCKLFKYDTLIAAHCIWPETPRSLAYLASICINVPMWKETQSIMPAYYNCSDAVNTLGIWEIQKKLLTKHGLWDIFNHEMAQVYPAMFLQLHGIDVNLENKERVLTDLNRQMESLNYQLDQEVGKTVNFNSPKQLAELLYIDMGLPTQYKRRKSIQDQRKVTTDKEALNKLYRKTGNTTLKKILEYKGIKKLISSFIDIELSPEGKVHTCYNITGATMAKQYKAQVIDDEGDYKSFGRWSSSKSIILPYGSGNLQNVPYEARKLYVAPPGYEILQADYMQAEAVVVAFIIRDLRLMKMFRESFGLTREERKRRGLDVHNLTAAMLHGIPARFEDRDDGVYLIFGAPISKNQRGQGKTIRHANNYSAGPGVVANRLGCSMREAKDLQIQFHNSTPQLKLWHKSIQEELRRTRTLTNLLGRKHKFLDKWGDSLFRSAYSFIPQSTVGDLLNKSLCRFYYKYGKERSILLQLHDAIYILSPLGHREESMAMLRETMIEKLTYDKEEFYIDIDFSVGPNWGSLEEL
jgi:uracil-DNA glycosylase family 4